MWIKKKLHFPQLTDFEHHFLEKAKPPSNP